MVLAHSRKDVRKGKGKEVPSPLATVMAMARPIDGEVFTVNRSGPIRKRSVQLLDLGVHGRDVDTVGEADRIKAGGVEEGEPAAHVKVGA